MRVLAVCKTIDIIRCIVREEASRGEMTFDGNIDEYDDVREINSVLQYGYIEQWVVPKI